MSVRALSGIVQALEGRGNCKALSNSAIRPSTLSPRRHSALGLRLITVSNISVGAGSVAVSARPALPDTEATSGTVVLSLFCGCKISAPLVTDRPGDVVGLYINGP